MSRNETPAAPGGRGRGVTTRRPWPVLAWASGYRREDLPGDLVAGVIVAVMLVPQGMAYAMLAGLPPQSGLYVSILPPLLYALLGSSRTLAVGPVAIASLMVASALGEIARPGSPEYLTAALVLAGMSGLMLLAMAAARLGLIVNFLSHPVISGFTSAAALVIMASQLKHLLGVAVPRDLAAAELLRRLPALAGQINPVTAMLGLGAIALLLFWRGRFVALLLRLGVPKGLAGPLGKAGPLGAVVLTAGTVWALGLDGAAGVAIVGAIPAGLPALTMPSLDPALWRELLPAAALIAIVGFLESVSVAKALASKRRQKIDPNRELVALGAANLGAALSGGYPVAGGFGRSVVNFTAGAVTPLASIVTALLVALTLVLFTPLFHFLPRAALAAVIVVAVASLVDVATLQRTWAYNRADAIALIVTFLAVLSAGVELGIIAGAGLSIALYLWRTSRPHIAVVGRVGESEHFRNVNRHVVRTCPHVLAVRIDESLYFANAGSLEQHLLGAVADNREIEHVVLICSAINFIDASALESLEALIVELRDAGVTLHLAEVKGPVMDALQRTAFLSHLGDGRVFLSTHDAMRALDCV